MSKPSAKRERIDWSKAPVLFIPRQACPHCGCEEYDRQRTENNGDGSSTRLYVCRVCRGAYKVSDEIPDSGNETVWPDYISP